MIYLQNHSNGILLLFFKMCIYFWLRWVFVATQGLLSSCGGGVLSVVTSVGRGEALGAQASGVAACRL